MRCSLGPKKLRKVQAIVGERYEVKSATVRGGGEHFIARTFMLDREALQKTVLAEVDYANGTFTILSENEERNG